MLILAFDTTSPQGGAVLCRDAECLAEVRAEGAVNYSVALFEMSARLLAAAGSCLADVELFAAATGPGSFTGIRVGLAAAQGFAKAFGRPVCGFSVLESMVEAAQPEGRMAVPLLDARRGEFYLGVFRRSVSDEAAKRGKGGFRLSGESRVLDAARVSGLMSELMRAGETEAALDVKLVVREQDQAALELAAQLAGPVKRITVPGLQAPSVARLALRAASEGRLQQPEQLDALYIRCSDAEINWRE